MIYRYFVYYMTCNSCSINYNDSITYETKKKLIKSAKKDGWICNDKSNFCLCPNCV